MAAVAGFAPGQSRAVAQRGAFRVGLSPVGLLADRAWSFAMWGRCAATRAFLPAKHSDSTQFRKLLQVVP
jgi:hypothetical protein